MSKSSCPYRPFGTLRFLLAVLVMIQHFGANIAPVAVQAAVYPLAVGTVAVMVFFVLSGFIIAEAVHFNYQHRAGAFICNRFLRIVPPLAIAVTVSALVHAVLWQQGGVADLEGHPRGPEIFALSELALNYLSFLPGLREMGLLPDYSLFPYIWAIRAEVVFYCAMFAAVLAATVLGRKQQQGRAALPWARWTLALMGTGALLAAGASLRGVLPDLLALGAYFIFGAALFYTLNGRRMAALFLPLAAVLMAWHYSGTHAGKVLAYPQNMPVQFAVLGILVACVAVCAVLRVRSPRMLRVDRWLGEMSFPLYLYHYPVGIVFATLYAGQHSILTLLSAGVVSCGVSVGIYAVVEPPLRRVRNRVRGRALNMNSLAGAVSDDGKKAKLLAA
jgi:peptidoglycan/LPS O-acetylase OafA/YrhL